jgi:hypothetical protein
VICRKAFERDLAAFVIDPHDPTWAEFREHYPTCPDCAGEVGAWTELQVELQSGEGKRGPHPSKELLLSYEERRETLQPAELRAIEGHLACCHACADELRALRRFDFAVLRRPASRRRERSWNVVREFPSWLRAVVWHPAFAYALVLILLYPTVMHLRRAGNGLPTEALVPERRIALELTEQPSIARPGVASDVGESEAAKRPAASEAPQRSEVDSHLAAARTPPRRTTAPLKQPGRLARAGAGTSRTTTKGSASKPAGTPALGAAKAPALAEQTTLAGPAPADHAVAGEHAGTNEPRVADYRGDGSDDTEETVETETSGALARRAPSKGDPGKPHVLGFADTEEPRDDAKRDRLAALASAIIASKKEAGTGGSWHTIVLAPDRAPEVRLDDLATGVSLRLPSSTLPPATRDIEVQVVGPDGRKTARNTFRYPSAEHVEIRIRAGELATGTYRVLVRGMDGGTPSDQATEFVFVVR